MCPSGAGISMFVVRSWGREGSGAGSGAGKGSDLRTFGVH